MKNPMSHRSIPWAALALIACILASAPAGAAEPVGITAIDARAGVVTARVAGSKQMIQFKVTSAALLKSLKVGQTVYADLGTQMISLNKNDQEPCCNILSVQPATPINDAGSETQATGQAMQNAPGDPFGRGGPPRKISVNHPSSCSTCAGECQKCTDANQDCNCTYVGPASQPGEPDIYHCTCSGPEPRLPTRNR